MNITSNTLLNSFILTQEKTLCFIEDINKNCLEVDSKGLKETLSKYGLLNHSEAHEFLIQADEMFEKFKSNPTINVKSVNNFETKCIACSFGKTVKGYKVEYTNNENGLNVIYNWSFAINLSIQNGVLIEFAHCNGFLSDIEYENI